MRTNMTPIDIPGHYPPKRRRRRKRGCVRPLLCLLGLLTAVIGIAALRPLLDKRHRVVIDPGHGGLDSGAVGIVTEAEMTEQTAAFLIDLLQEDGRFAVWQTRETGEGEELSARCRTARLHRAELLLSIHGNSADDPSARGFECYPAPPGREHHQQSRRFAELIAGRAAEAGLSLRGDSGVRYAYYSEEGVKELVDGTDEQVREEPSFGMVEHPGCPAVLAEQCFVTNPEDSAQFGTEEGCEKMAYQYYLAILDYFGLVLNA